MFFYNDNNGMQGPPASGLTYSASPSSLSFTQTNEQFTFNVTVSGVGGDSYSLSSSNPQFSVSTNHSGGISGGDVITIYVTFTGSDNTQFGTVSFNGLNFGSVSVQVDSYGYTTVVGGPGDGGGDIPI